MAASSTSNATPRDSGYVSSDGLQIHFQQYGEGPPLVLVHGWGADIETNWVASGWIASLAPLRTVIAIDVRGHGRSDKPLEPAPYSYSAMSRDVLAVMDALEIERADFMGYSMGAFMGAYLLGHHGERFVSMILGGIGDETPASAAQGAVIATALRAQDPADVRDPVGKGVRAFVESNPLNDLEALAFSARQMWPEGFPLTLAGADVGRVAVPVLIVDGSEDHPYVDSADAFADALADATNVTIEGRDHLSVVADPAFKQIVVDFLTRR